MGKTPEGLHAVACSSRRVAGVRRTPRCVAPRVNDKDVPAPDLRLTPENVE